MSGEKKKGLSILAFVLVVVGFLLEIFHCLCDLEIFVNFTGNFVPTFDKYVLFYWLNVVVGAALIVGGFVISEVLQKKNLGNEKLNKVTSGIFWVALLFLIVAIAAGIFSMSTRIHYF